jgi:uncharacterized protein YndB with AHSA1/START domain
VNGTLHTLDGRSVLRFERRFAHPVEKVWRAVTDPAEMAHWFPAPVAMDLRLGGRVRFGSPGGDMEATEGSITELDPPRAFAFTWNGDPLRIELRPDGDGTLLIFTHTFGDRPMAGSFATGWETCLGALDTTLTDPAQAVSIAPERYAERHDAYVEAFGLDEGAVRDDGTVRFERLLPHPVEQVWAALTGADAGPAVGGPPPAALAADHLPPGVLTEVTAHETLEYAWPAEGEPAGRVRWRLTGGHPAGTRVVLTQTSPPGPSGDRVTVLATWHARLDHLAGVLRGGDPGPWPGDRVEELTKRYADQAR